jgi:hypothetical protein
MADTHGQAAPLIDHVAVPFTRSRTSLQLELPLIWNHSPFNQSYPLSLLRITPFSSFLTAALSCAKRRRTLDRWKASTVILKSDGRTVDYPVHSREQLSYYPEHYPHGKPIITLLLSHMSVQVPRAIHVPACQSFPINYFSLDRYPYQLALDLTTLSRQSARTRALRRLHLTLAGRGLQLLSCPYRRPGSTPRITRTSL